jgi:hypothetical protein
MDKWPTAGDEIDNVLAGVRNALAYAMGSLEHVCELPDEGLKCLETEYSFQRDRLDLILKALAIEMKEREVYNEWQDRGRNSREKEAHAADRPH